MIYQLLGAVFILTWLMTRLIRQYALAHHIVDIPNHRSSHQEMIPRSGGLGFVVVLLLLLPALFYFQKLSLPACLAFSCSALVALVGFLDDKYQVSFSKRLLVHFFGWFIGDQCIGRNASVIVRSMDHSSRAADEWFWCAFSDLDA